MNTYEPEGMRLSSPLNTAFVSSRAGLERAAEEGAIVEAPVILCDGNFDLHVSLGGGMRGIIPRAEAAYSDGDDEVRDIAVLTRVGKPVAFKVTGFFGDGKSTVALLSRRAAQRECLHSYVEGLMPGDIIPAKVTHLENFGAFVDVGCGIVSLLPIDCLSVSRIEHPRQRLSVGQHITCAVRGKDAKGRLFVSTKELLGTWEECAAAFREGETVRGIVRGTLPYGIFVELLPNLSGLAECRDGIRVGQTAAVYIKSIIPEKMKIKLVIIDTNDEKIAQEPLHYFTDRSKVSHIDKWVYSPSSASRVIETVFAV